MKSYKNKNKISDSDLLLLELDPMAAREEWCYLVKHKPQKFLFSRQTNIEFVPLWIKGDKIVFLSKYVLLYHKFDSRSNKYENSEIRKYIKKYFGKDFDLLNVKECEKLDGKMLHAYMLPDKFGENIEADWWVLPSGYYDFDKFNPVVYDGDFNGSSVVNDDDIGVRIKFSVKLSRLKKLINQQ